jgi:hypothetical protein
VEICSELRRLRALRVKCVCLLCFAFRVPDKQHPGADEVAFVAETDSKAS